MNLCEAVRKAGTTGIIRNQQFAEQYGNGASDWMLVDDYFRYHFHRLHLLLDDFEVKREAREWTAYVDVNGGLRGGQEVFAPDSHWNKVRVREIFEGEV